MFIIYTRTFFSDLKFTPKYFFEVLQAVPANSRENERRKIIIPYSPANLGFHTPFNDVSSFYFHLERGSSTL